MDGTVEAYIKKQTTTYENTVTLGLVSWNAKESN